MEGLNPGSPGYNGVICCIEYKTGEATPNPYQEGNPPLTPPRRGFLARIWIYYQFYL